jgi:hypothetical protein
LTRAARWASVQGLPVTWWVEKSTHHVTELARPATE